MSNIKKILPIILLVLFVALGATALFYYRQYSALRKNPQVLVQNETDTLVAKVGELIALPEDEVPTIATVNEPEKLQGQPFFASAKKGDKVLIYTKAKKAYLYDPAAHKILEVAPLTIGGSEQAQNESTPAQ